MNRDEWLAGLTDEQRRRVDAYNAAVEALTDDERAALFDREADAAKRLLVATVKATGAVEKMTEALNRATEASARFIEQIPRAAR